MSNKDSRARRIWELFLTFMKIGGFTFGGGYAMIPLIQRETVEVKGWITDEDILEIIAIAESTPGPIAINSATFVGYRTAGVLGSAAATLGVVLPSFVIISLISFVLTQFQELKAVQYAFFGIRAGVLALIVKAFLTMYKKCPKGILSYIIWVFAFACSALLGVNVMIAIVASALLGIITTLVNKRRLDGKK